ncbi:MAG TPA: RcpC/CpaB family pilus assembly protein [Clostridia bacterium]|nr:RcpC/CpaB family pilus assembly protein [Clostridia bacterium]
MKFLRSRILWGIIALVAAAGITFFAIPALNAQTRETVTVVRVKEPIAAETQLTADMLTTSEVGAYGCPEDAFSAVQSVAGLYASVDLIPTDTLVPAKLTSTLNRANESFYSLPEIGKQAVSVPLSSLSASVSGKLQPDDIVTVYGVLKNKETDIYEVIQYPELQYMRVAAVTNAVAVDTDQVDTSDNATSKSDVVPATVTLYAFAFQTRRLIEIQTTGSVYIALVGRGAEATRLYDAFTPVDPYAVKEVPVVLMPDRSNKGIMPQLAE